MYKSVFVEDSSIGLNNIMLLSLCRFIVMIRVIVRLIIFFPQLWHISLHSIYLRYFSTSLEVFIHNSEPNRYDVLILTGSMPNLVARVRWCLLLLYWLLTTNHIKLSRSFICYIWHQLLSQFRAYFKNTTCIGYM